MDWTVQNVKDSKDQMRAKVLLMVEPEIRGEINRSSKKRKGGVTEV